MRRVRGRSFKITKNQANGYGYAKARSMKANPGVTTIAAINGRGSYSARKNSSARSVMSKLKKNARVGVARQRLSAAQKDAFKRRMAAGRMAANRSASRSQSAASRKNIKKAQAARKAWGRKLPRGRRFRVGGAAYGKKPKARRLKAGVYVANRKKAGSKTMARRRKRASGLKKKRRSSKRRRKTTAKTTTVKRRRRRKSRKGAARRKTAAKKTVRRKRRRTAKKAAPKRRRRRAKASSAPKRRRRRKAAKKGTSRKRRRSKKASAAPKRRRSRRRRKSAKASSKRRKSSGRRRSRKGYNRKPQTTRLLTANGRRSRSRKHRRNGRRGFKMNGVGDVVKLGATLFTGFALHRVASNLISKKLIPLVLPAPAPAATSGVASSDLVSWATTIGTAIGAGFLAGKAVKNTETRKAIQAGIVLSAAQSLVVSILQKFAPPEVSEALAGPEDGLAARLSAMYGVRGLGAGASIMPRYAPINGLGEYFREPMNGLGEYFREPMNGLGEYISATNGLGSYEPNGDLYQAAAGFGSHDYNGNHIDPSGNLDRQLDIVEAAAGVGAIAPFEAAAGIGPMQAAAGFGNIDTVPSADTWIPGSVDGQLWAGVRAVTNPQSATEMVPAGTLQSEGGSGIFG